MFKFLPILLLFSSIKISHSIENDYTNFGPLSYDRKVFEKNITVESDEIFEYDLSITLTKPTNVPFSFIEDFNQYRPPFPVIYFINGFKVQ